MSTPKKKPAAEDSPPSFEAALAELEEIVARLEGGRLPLAESLAAYELGVKRLASCYQSLRDAERKIQLVRGVDAGGTADAVPFDDEDGGDDLSEKSSARSRRRTAKGPAPARPSVDDDTSLF